jgi:hypothetical protein
MGKVRDVATKIDFETSPTHTIIFDAERDTRTEEGRNGTFDVIDVLEDGLLKTLPLSNQTLINQLRPLKGVHKLEVSRSGSSFDTKYTVKDLGLATPTKPTQLS